MDTGQKSRLGIMRAASKLRRQKLKLGKCVSLLHPLQMDDWSGDMTRLLPGMSMQQRLQQITYFKKRKLHGTPEVKILAAEKRLSANSGCVHSVEYHPIGKDSDIRVCYVRGLVVSCHKKSKARVHPYMVWCRIHKETGVIQEADCHCPPGLKSGMCLHILALLYHIAKLTEQSSEHITRVSKKTGNKAATKTSADSVCIDNPKMMSTQGPEMLHRLHAPLSSTPHATLADSDLDKLAEITTREAGILANTSRFRTPHPTPSVEPDLMHIATDLHFTPTTSLTWTSDLELFAGNDMVDEQYEKLPHVDAIGHHLLHHQKDPVVFSNAISHWPAAAWTPNTLRYLLGDQRLTFRIGRRDATEIQWESECDYESATVGEFVDWEVGVDASIPSPLSTYDPAASWSYCDYKHFMQQFPDRPDFLKAVDWSVFGFPRRDGAKSTFWMGSAGAHTQCHYDSYGCNLVAQVFGKKRWVLFPPTHTHLLYPTRIPYEESSVFSNVKIDKPDLHQHPKFKETTPYVVTLEPGDVLYVPRHWWHDVTSLTTSISVNMWIELPCDNEERVREAITRTVVMTTMKDTDAAWLNPNEELSDFEDNINCLRNSLLLASTNERPAATAEDESGSEDDLPQERKRKRPRHQTAAQHSECCSCDPSYPHIQLSDRLTTKSVSAWQFDDYCRNAPGGAMPSGYASDNGGPTKGLEVALANSLLHPHIVRRVCKLLKENVRL